MEIQHSQSDQHGRFHIDEGTETVAELVYSGAPGKPMNLEHTFVDDELRGQQIGFKLVQSAVEYARTEGLKIIPTCIFAKAIFDRKPEFGDVLEGKA